MNDSSLPRRGAWHLVHTAHCAAIILSLAVGIIVLVALFPGGADAVQSMTPSQTLTFTPVADARVEKSTPKTNYGASTALGVDARPLARSYLRFQLPELSGTVRKAELLLWARSGSTGGFAVHPVMSNDWRERRITYANAPKPSSDVVDWSGPFTAPSWTTVDVSSLVTRAGTYSLALTTPGGAAINLASRESDPSRHPQLRVYVNSTPNVAPDALSTDEDTPTVVKVLDNDTDAEGDVLRITTPAPEASRGSVSCTETECMYTPSPNYSGADSFMYTASDGYGGIASAAVKANVTPVNDPPVAKNDTKSVMENSVVVFRPTSNDSPGPPDESDQELAIDSISVAPSHGTAEVITDGIDAGRIRYTPVPNYDGFESFTYKVCEIGTDPLCNTATVSMTVVRRVVPTVETAPVPHSGDAADDPAIWINPSDPARSTIIGTDKQGGVAVYNLAGTQLEYKEVKYRDQTAVDRPATFNNVDIRADFPLAGQPAALVAASDRTKYYTTSDKTQYFRRIILFNVERETGKLAGPVGEIKVDFEPYGLCMYHSQASGKFYVFVTSRYPVGNVDGYVEQWEISDNGSGQVNANKVSSFGVGSQTEGCVADDELGHLYLGEEDVGIWKYAAEPNEARDDDHRVLVDTATGPGGHLAGDVEGLTIAYGPNGTGYLLASSQGHDDTENQWNWKDAYAIYQREGSNAYVRTFRVKDGNGIDGTEDTDGIDVTTASLGSSFPNGVFVTQDGVNATASGTANQNFKLVPLQSILEP